MKSAFTEGLKVRETLKILETLTYTCEYGDALIDLNNKLNETLFQFRKCIPTSEGITVRPAIAQRTLIKSKIMRAKIITQKYGSLQLRTKRGPKRLDASYRNRVGKKASSLRKVASSYNNHTNSMINQTYDFYSRLFKQQKMKKDVYHSR